MFNWLWGKIKDAWDKTNGLVSGIWNSLKGGFAWVVALLTTVAASVRDIAEWIGTLIAGVASALGWLSAQNPTQPDFGGLGTLLAFANTFIPLQEAFTYIQTLILMMSVALTIRTAKLIREWVIA